MNPRKYRGLDAPTTALMAEEARRDYDAAVLRYKEVSESLAVAASTSKALSRAASIAKKLRGKLDDGPTPDTMAKVFHALDVQVEITKYDPIDVTVSGLMMIEDVAASLALEDPSLCRRTTSSPRASGW